MLIIVVPSCPLKRVNLAKKQVKRVILTTVQPVDLPRDYTQGRLQG